MRSWRAGRYSGRWYAIACVSVLLWVLLPASSRAAEGNLSSRTYFLYYKENVAGTGDQRFAPLYEYLSGDVRELGGSQFSFHFYGWGRIDFADETDDKKQGGELGSAYLQYNHPTGNAEMRLGRFFLTEGTAAEIVDGAFLKGRTPFGLGLSVFGGLPVERSITSSEEGDSIYGGRIFYSRAGIAEFGVTYLKEKGNFQGHDREMAGGDFWLKPGIPAELSGRAAYNVSTSALASQRYILRMSPFTRIDLAVGYEDYKYKDLFQTALHPAFLSPSIDNTDSVRTLFAMLDLAVSDALTVEAGAKNIRHDRSDPGDAVRAELGLRYSYNDRKDVGGLSAAVVSADQSRYGYQEYRTFASYSPGRWRFSLDALTQQYKEKISDVRDSYQVVGSAGWQVYPYLSVSGDLTYTKSPRFSYDYAGLLRVSVDLGFSTGGQGKGAPSGSKAAGVANPARPGETSPATGISAGAAASDSLRRAAETTISVPVPPGKSQEDRRQATAAVSPEKTAVDPVDAYLDRMVAEIRAKLPDAVVNRKGEVMEITLPSDLLFDSGSAGMKPGAMQSLATAAGIFNRFPDTLITVEGHTDSTGTAAGNQELSEKRARSVFTVLVRNGVHALRISMRGYGDRFPVADNAKPDGQRSNRRVQMKIRPDENLKARQSQGR